MILGKMFSLQTLVPQPDFKHNSEKSHWRYERRNGIYYSWSKVSAEARDFVKFNKKLQTFDNLEEILHQVNSLQVAQEWTLEELKYFLDLAIEYDERFYIIQDRYDWENKTRNLEELKEIYFLVKKKFIKEKSGETLDKNYLKYDKIKDVQRRKNLEKLWNRTDEEIKEEEILVKEGKRRLFFQKDWINHSQELYLKLKDGRVDAPSVPPSTLSALLEKSSKKRKEANQEFKAEFKRKRASLSSIDEKGALEDVLSRKVQSIYLRSTKMLPVKSGLQAKVNLLLEEHGVPVKPKMATERIIKKYDELREKAKDILEMKKQLEKIEHDLKVVKIRNGEIPDDALDVDASGSVAKKGLKKRSHSPKNSGSRQMKKSRN
jgi:DNA methyltransferase 1-associated protein 1